MRNVSGSMSTRFFSVIISLLLATSGFLLYIPLCSARGDSPSIDAELSISHLPEVSEEATISFHVKSGGDLGPTRGHYFAAIFLLPEENNPLVWLNGTHIWMGFLYEDDIVDVVADVRAVSEGESTIYAMVCELDDSQNISNVDFKLDWRGEYVPEFSSNSSLAGILGDAHLRMQISTTETVLLSSHSTERPTTFLETLAENYVFCLTIASLISIVAILIIVFTFTSQRQKRKREKKENPP